MPKRFSTTVVLDENDETVLLIPRKDFRIWALPGLRYVYCAHVAGGQPMVSAWQVVSLRLGIALRDLCNFLRNRLKGRS